jgi:hypothetical protein
MNITDRDRDVTYRDVPSPRHDTINRMFRESPELAVEILRHLLGVDVPDDAPVRLESNDFNDRPSRDFKPDTVITVGPPQEPVHGIVVEVQQKKSGAKRKQLPRYAAQLWLLLDCPVTVLCICPDSRAAAWYAEPIPAELPGYVLRPAVLGPGDVPVITQPEEAADSPALAAMAVMVHGRNRTVAEAFVAAMPIMKPDYASQYYEYAFKMAAPAVRRILGEIMASTEWPVYSPFAREHYGRGEADGLAKGRTKGRAEGEAEAVVKVLAVRGIEVPEDALARIRACTDKQQLDTWLERAVAATSITDLFD